jgi:hypothetical protein
LNAARAVDQCAPRKAAIVAAQNAENVTKRSNKHRIGSSSKLNLHERHLPTAAVRRIGVIRVGLVPARRGNLGRTTPFQ